MLVQFRGSVLNISEIKYIVAEGREWHIEFNSPGVTRLRFRRNEHETVENLLDEIRASMMSGIDMRGW